MDTSKTTPIGFDYVSSEACRVLASEPTCHILATVVHGIPEVRPPDQWPQVDSRFQTFDQSSPIEVISTNEPVSYIEDDGVKLAQTDRLLFAACEIAEAGGNGLAEITRGLYTKLLHISQRMKYPHILRMWNIVGAINSDQNEIERYKLFCMGRHEAFRMVAPHLAERYPSACALGSHSGELCVYFLASQSEGDRIENPNQVSAYRYPSQYGPRSPSFSRALIKHWQEGASLFVSGTASITGHQSRHVGNIAGQVKETVSNLRALIAAAEKRSHTRFDLNPETSLWKVYIRNAADYRTVREFLEAEFGSDLKMLYLEADICREELLFEIDGTVFTHGEA